MQAEDINKLFSLLKNKEKNGDEAAAEVNEALNGLSADQKEKLDGILSSPEKIKELLSSEKAKEIIKKLGGGD
ncbi:MAG: hypothetical protein IJS90_08830 [Clostridia bacterium]|nr:hypothetical protein [Clostridia bacterium]